MKILPTVFPHEEGNVAIEYALIVSLVSLVLITALTSLGLQLSMVFSTIQAALAR